MSARQSDMEHAEKTETGAERAGAAGDHAVLVTSIGTAGASIVAALKEASSLPEQFLAYRLFQAPSILFGSLAEPLAIDVARVLRGAGVECEVVPRGHRFTQGDADHEVALAVRDVAGMQAVLEGVMTVLGVGAPEAKRIACATPAVLMGRVSAATAGAIRRRFEPLGVEVDVSRLSEARFDAFLGDGSKDARAAAEKLAASVGIAVHPPSKEGDAHLLATDLPRASAELLHGHAARNPGSILLLNRDFQRFDICLEAAPSSPEMVSFLVETAAMPERIVPKVLARLPLVTHQSVRHATLCELLSAVEARGGKATGRLTSFQRFALVLLSVKDAAVTEMLLRDLGGLSKVEVDAALGGAGKPVGALTGTLARWLCHELELRGTKSRMVLR